MLNQAFSVDNFERIFDIENRKGNVESLDFGEDYKNCLLWSKEFRTKIKQLSRIKKSERTDEQTVLLQELNVTCDELIKIKKEIRHYELENISKQVNNKAFQFNLNTKDDDKFVIDNSMESFFAIKQLQYNIHKTFNVKQSNRHTILSQIKLLLNEGFPKYIIRTDITKFFESIPQEKLLKKVENNTLLNIQSKNFIKQILTEYNRLKDKKLIEENKGVPRGVGISSYLSELYMKDIDNKIRNLSDVIYYVRYVDDMFIIISPAVPAILVHEYYTVIEDIVNREDLSLKPVGDDKCNLLDLFPQKDVTKNESITYLGYKLYITQEYNKITTTFGLSDSKKEKIRNRISKSIDYYNATNKYDVKQAKKELLLCLRFLSTNSKLTGSKSRVKTGIYYSHDLLDNDHLSDITDLDVFLERQTITPYRKLFASKIQREVYIDNLKCFILALMNSD